jgi:hypothetical protein
MAFLKLFDLRNNPFILLRKSLKTRKALPLLILMYRKVKVPGMVAHPNDFSTGRLRQENGKFEVSLR